MGIQNFSMPSTSMVLFTYDHPKHAAPLDVRHDDVTYVGDVYQRVGDRYRSLYLTPLSFYWNVLRHQTPGMFWGNNFHIVLNADSDSLGRREARMDGVSLGLLTSISEARAAELRESGEMVIEGHTGLLFGFVPLDEPKSIGEREERKAKMDHERSHEEITELKRSVAWYQQELETANNGLETLWEDCWKAQDTIAELQAANYRLRQQVTADSLTIKALHRVSTPVVSQRMQRFGLIDTMPPV
jgi:hypothetical protein